MATAKDEIAELKEQVALLTTQLQAVGKGQRVFKVASGVDKKKNREEVLAARSEEPKTYRALENGTDLKQGFIARGTVFTTTQPQGSWMEPVEDARSRKSADKDD